jgi:hypothetical protein
MASRSSQARRFADVAASKECDAKLAEYRELLEVNSEITSAATWIAEVERERRSIERDLDLRLAGVERTSEWCQVI